MMPQANGLQKECDVVVELLARIPGADFEQANGSTACTINREESVPKNKPYVCNEASGINCVKGSAGEFCQVVTQTRNCADTDLTVISEVVNRWMAVAQCFAGPPQTPRS